MSIRPYHASDDFEITIDLVRAGFQYPENAEWDIQDDAVENLIDELDTTRRLQPLMNIFGLVVPVLKKFSLGYIWEEDGQAVGLVNVSPKSLDGSAWIIGNVVVLPDYRRRGIARQLVEACIDLARENKARTVMLEVIAGNVPAVKLYERMGMSCYTGLVYLERKADAALPAQTPQPAGYRMTEYEPATWDKRYALAKRLTPPEVQDYEPVTEGRFRRPWYLRPLRFLFKSLSGMSAMTYLIESESSGEVVAEAGYHAREDEGGYNELNLLVDPQHPDLAEYLASLLVHQVTEQSPGRRIELVIPTWQPVAIEAALKAGFQRNIEGQLMGMAL